MSIIYSLSSQLDISSHTALLLESPPHLSSPLHKLQHPHALYTAGPGTRSLQLPSKDLELISLPLSVGGSDPVTHELKAVSLPLVCLMRFTSIASINTARNCETCGLLLGKDMEGCYIVTTLLIPKQHGTSCTCAMDEEELVMQFTEERSLITLGWVRSHLRR